MIPQVHILQEQERIYKLLLKRLTDVLTPEDEDFIQKILQENPQARHLQDQLEDIFLESDSFEDFFQNIGEEEAAEQAYLLEQPLKEKRKSLRIIGIAASILLFAIGAAYVFLALSDSNEKIKEGDIALKLADGQTIALTTNDTGRINTDNAIFYPDRDSLNFSVKNPSLDLQWNTLSIPPGHTYSVKLSDGTTIHLNESTTLRFPLAFSDIIREVFVEGEVYFVISPHEQRPFVVHTKMADINVLGTDFNVNTYEGGLKVSLVSGSVLVKARRERITLKPGLEAELNRSTGLFSIKHFDDATVSWMKDEYLFYNKEIGEVCKVIESWYNLKVVYDDPAIARHLFTGTLKKRESYTSLLVTLKDVADIRSYFDKDSILHFTYKNIRNGHHADEKI